MQTKMRDESIRNTISLLTFETDLITIRTKKFGYRERVKIERGLFLLLKQLCQKKLDYNIQGFSQIHRENLNKTLAKFNCDRNFVQILDQIFQLKIFIKQLSSENAYVRGDTLSRAVENKDKVMAIIRSQSLSIVRKINMLEVEQLHSQGRS